MRRYLLPLIIVGVLLAPAVVSAADWFPLVQCGAAGQSSCTPCDLFKTFKNVIDLVLYGITGPVAAFMIVWAGGMMLLGGAKPELFKQGKDMLRSTLIGVSIILLAWLITNTLIKSLATGNTYDRWFEFSCPAALLNIFKEPIETALPTGGPPIVTPSATILTAANAGPATLGATMNLCGNELKCPAPGGCPTLAQYTSKYGNAKMLQAIMLNESSCRINPPPSGAGAYGLMQLKPETALRFVDACDLYHEESGKRVPDRIDAGFLQSELNVKKVVCIASKFIESLSGACGSNPSNIAAGYNGGPGACLPSKDCAQTRSCTGGTMRRWECPWDTDAIGQKVANIGYRETRVYAPKVAACAQ